MPAWLLKRDDRSALPIQVALAYTVGAIVWIVGWDLLAATAPIDEQVVRMIRRTGYVGVTALLLWWIVRRSVKRIEALQARFDAIADQGVVGIFVAQGNRLTYVNDRLCEMLGYSRRELTSRTATDFLDPTELERARVQGWGGGEGEVYRRFLARRGDGTTLATHVVRRRVELEDGPALVGIVLDASRAEALEGRLKKSAKLEVLGQITGSVTDDFNNLLAAMIGQLDRALGSVTPTQPAYGGLAVARDTARRAAALTGQLLTFTRAEKSPTQLLDVTATVRGLTRLFASLAGPKTKVRYELDDTLSPVTLDLGDFDQVLANLFVSAKEAVQEGGTITLRTRPVVRDGHARVAIEVEDSGRGSPEDLRLITARAVLEDAGGELEIEGGAAGTLVRALLPRRSPALGSEASASARARAGWRAGHTVLVVDDEAPVRRVIGAALRRLGYRVLEAGEAGAAMKHVLAEDPRVELVVCDFLLEGEKGPHLVRRMMRERPELKAVFVTGLSTREVLADDPSLAAFPFIEKPFSVEELTTSVDRVWENASSG